MTAWMASLRERVAATRVEVASRPWGRVLAEGRLPDEAWAAWLDADVAAAGDWLNGATTVWRLAPTPAARDGWQDLGRFARADLGALHGRLARTLGLAVEDLGHGTHRGLEGAEAPTLAAALSGAGNDYAPVVATLLARPLLMHEVARGFAGRRLTDRRALDWQRTWADPGVGRALRWIEAELARETDGVRGSGVPEARSERARERFVVALQQAGALLGAP